MRDKGGKRSKNVGGGLPRPPPPPVSSPVIHKSRSRSSGHRKSETVRAVAKQGRSQEPPSDNHYPQNDMYGHASNVVDERRLSHHSARKEDPPDEFPKTQRSRSKTKRKDDTHDHNNINSNSEVRRSNVDHSQESREPSARASLQDVMRKSTKKRGDSTSNGFSNDSTARISNSKNDRSGIKKNKQTRQPPTSSSKPKFHENTGLSFLNSDTDNDYPLLDLEEQQYEQYQEQLYNQQYLQQPQLQQCDPSTSTQHRQFNLSPLYDLEMTSMGNINKKSSKKDSSNQHKNQKQKKIDQHHQSSHARKSSQGSKKQSNVG